MIIQTSKVYNDRIYIPKEIRERFNIQNGDSLIWSIADGKLTLMTQDSKGEKTNRFKVSTN